MIDANTILCLVTREMSLKIKFMILNNNCNVEYHVQHDIDYWETTCNFFFFLMQIKKQFLIIMILAVTIAIGNLWNILVL